VRYVSLSFGENTHRPALPDVVLERRFGDCKDKSLLLVALLRALGFKADVALVNSTRGYALSYALPSIDAFDHAIVTVEIGNERYFLDPTRLYQRGSLREVSPRGLHLALILNDAQKELTWVNEGPRRHPDLRVQAEYCVEKIGGPVDLAITRTYGGELAELMRALHASTSEQAFAEAAAGAIVKTYEHADRFGGTSFNDDTSQNQVVVEQHFHLGACWLTPEGGRPVLAVAAYWLRDVLPAATPDRTKPLSVPHPLNRIQDSTLIVMGGIAAEPTTVEFATRFFRFKEDRHPVNTVRLALHDEYTSKTYRVDEGDLAEYRAAVDKLSNALFVAIVQTRELTAAEKLAPWWIGLATTAWALGIVVSLAFVYRRKPYLKRASIRWSPELAGRRGWLGLLGAGATLAPVVYAYRLETLLPVFSATNWAPLTRVDDPAYRALRAPVLLGVLLFAVLMLLVTAFVAFLFWKKHRSFPLLFLFVIVMGFVGVLAEYALLDAFPTNESDHSPSTVLSVVSSVLWSIYVLYSERVKATFLPPPADEP
jgi:hypothetical protein